MDVNKRNRSGGLWISSRAGGDLAGFGLMLAPLMLFMLLVVDTAWVVFARATLQRAVREGVRFGVTGRTLPGMGHKESIRTVVQRNASGLLGGERGRNSIQVRFYISDTFQDVSDVEGGNGGGNIVEVSVDELAIRSLPPFFRTPVPLTFRSGIRSSDRLEANARTGPPPL